MEIDDRGRLLAPIDPANSFSAGVREVLEINLQIDLVSVVLPRFLNCLRVQLLTATSEKNAHENAEHENVARRNVLFPFVHLWLTSLARCALPDRD